MAAADFARWFLALFFVGVASFYTVRILFWTRRTGSSPVHSGTPGSVHFATHLAFRVFRVLILAVCLARLFWPPLDRFLLPFATFWHPAILLAGCCVLAVSFATIIAFHFHMGESWRSGTRAEDGTRLITTGPYAVSRNPMMLCVMAAQVGLFLALPTAFTLICLVVGVWAVLAQVNVEERLLHARFGADYDAYASRTPRWLGTP